jgi:tubulin epsilon
MALRQVLLAFLSLLRLVPRSTSLSESGLCKAPPVNQPYSLLTLSNNCCIADTFTNVYDRCMKLYRVGVSPALCGRVALWLLTSNVLQAHLHHYTGQDGFEEGMLRSSLENIRKLSDDYDKWSVAKPKTSSRISVLS